MGSSAERHLLVHGSIWLPSQTQHCCLLVLPSDPAMGCRADHELKEGPDGWCYLLQPLELHGGINPWRANGGEAGLESDRGSVPGRGGIYSGWGEKTALPAVPGRDKEQSTHSSSKEQRPRNGIFFFQSGRTSKT